MLSVRWSSAARGGAMTRDAGLQLQFYAWTGKNNGNFTAMYVPVVGRCPQNENGMLQSACA